MSRHSRVNVILVALNAIAAVALAVITVRHRCHMSIARPGQSAGLERRVTILKMNGTPLRDVLQQLHSQTGATFVLSPKLATRKVQGMHFMVDNGPGWKTPVWGEFQDVSVDDALNALCRQAKFAAPLHYGAMADGRIFLGADDEFPWIVRTYDVGNLTWLMPQPHTDSLVEDDSEAQNGPVRQFWTILPQTDQDRDGISIHPAWWLVNGRLVVVASRRAQGMIAAELEPLHGIHQSFPPGTTVIARNIVDLTGR